MKNLDKLKWLLFKLWHTIRGTLLAWLSIPFFIVGEILHWAADFFWFIAEKLKDNIPFNPLKAWKNIDCFKGKEDEFNFWTGKRK